jgi:hypothetical protein
MKLVGRSDFAANSVYFGLNFVKRGGKIRLQNYKSMPHVFQIFSRHPSTKTCFNEYGKFISNVTSGKAIETRFEMVNGKGVIEEEPLDLSQYQVSFSKEEVSSILAQLIVAYEENGIRSNTAFS